MKDRGQKVTLLHLKRLFEIIQESADSLQCGLALVFYLNLELDFHLADTTQILYLVKFGYHAYTAADSYRLTETHLVHSVIHLHLDIVHLGNVIPKMSQK